MRSAPIAALNPTWATSVTRAGSGMTVSRGRGPACPPWPGSTPAASRTSTVAGVAVPGKLVGGAFRAVAVNVGHDDRVAPGGQRAGQGQPDTRGGPVTIAMRATVIPSC